MGVAPIALTADYVTNAVDDCGLAFDGSCYYLAFDFGHRLHTFEGQTFGGSVIPGLTVGP